MEQTRFSDQARGFNTRAIWVRFLYWYPWSINWYRKQSCHPIYQINQIKRAQLNYTKCIVILTQLTIDWWK